jgi:hypothetical protein
MGVRLEVNHPLYALAWLGGAEVLARGASTTNAAAGRTPGDIAGVVAASAAVLALPVVILLTGATTFRVTDPFLWTLHDRYIEEFLPLGSWVLTRPPGTVAAEMSLVPLCALLASAALWPVAGTTSVRGWRALVLVTVAACAGYAYVFFFGVSRGSEVIGVAGALAASTLWFVWPAARGARTLSAPARAVLTVAVVPTIVLLVMAMLQVRWLGVAAALALATSVGTLSLALATNTVRGPLGAFRAGAWSLALAVTALPVVLSSRRPVAPSNVEGIVRDASAWLRQRVGDAHAVVLAGASSTNRMIWFGGFSGLGTLYWENLDGLNAAAEIYGSADADSARALLGARGITHVAFYGWDGGLGQLIQSRAEVGDGEGGGVGVLQRVEEALRRGASPSLPAWLVPLPYVPPRVAGYAHPIVHLFEVANDIPPELALVRLARHYQVLGDPRMEEALSQSLSIAPSAAGLAMEVQLARFGDSDRARFAEAVARLQENLSSAPTMSVEDRLEVAIALGLAGDSVGITRELGAVLEQADEAGLRRLRPERLTLLLDASVQLGLDRAHQAAVALARSIVPSG